MVVEDGQGDIWMLDRESGVTRALTSTARFEENATWSPDSQEIIVSGGREFLRMRADGSDTPRVAFLQTVQDRRVGSSSAWLPGDWLVLEVEEESGADDIFVLQLDDPTKLLELVTGGHAPEEEALPLRHALVPVLPYATRLVL